MGSLNSNEFNQRLQRLRSGDFDEINCFVAEYEPFIRRTLRFRIARAGLQSAADSVDVCQSVLGGFLLHLAAGEYALASEDDLRKLLVAIANKKFLVLNRRETATKRDHRQTRSIEQIGELAVNVQNETYKNLEYTEFLATVVSRLSPEEQRLFECRREGVAWEVIAKELSQDAILLRKRFSRALQRVAIELKLDPDE